jgi:UDP-glucose 4-epimerase
MRVLVTGGAGFIGSHTVDLLLENGYEVAVLDKKLDRSFHNPKAVYECADLLNKDRLAHVFKNFKPEAVIHLAAQVDVQTSMTYPDKDIDINLKGTVHLLEQCKQNQAKIVFASSAAVYGVPQQLPIHEFHDTHPLSIYGLSKLSAEHYIRLYHELYGVQYCVLRYANVYGPRQDSTGEGGVVSIFVDRLVHGQTPIIYGSGNQTRDFVFVKDVARANVLALKGGGNRIFNVCNTTEISINELLNQISSLLGKETVPNYLPEKKGDIFRSILDGTEIRKNLNWQSETELIEGLKDTIDYFR